MKEYFKNPRNSGNWIEPSKKQKFLFIKYYFRVTSLLELREQTHLNNKQIKCLCNDNSLDFESLKKFRIKKINLTKEELNKIEKFAKQGIPKMEVLKNIQKDNIKITYKPFTRQTQHISFAKAKYKPRMIKPRKSKFNIYWSGVIWLYNKEIQFDSKSELYYMIQCYENGAVNIIREPFRLTLTSGKSYLPDFIIIWNDKTELIEIKGSMLFETEISLNEKLSALELYCKGKPLSYKWIWSKEIGTLGKKTARKYKIKFDQEKHQKWLKK